ncbi:hypothetical protein L7F22_031766 [Adiantum nelumboides]|nr:hypothetical protein [Adiantum nelumboides]
MSAVSVIKKLQRWERIQNGTREEYYPVVTYKIKVKECSPASSSSSPPPSASTMLSINSSCSSLPLTASNSTRALADLTDSVAHLEKFSAPLHQSWAPTRSFPALRSPFKLAERESHLADADSCSFKSSIGFVHTASACKLQQNAEEASKASSGSRRWKYDPRKLQASAKERGIVEHSEEDEGMWAMFPWKLELQEGVREEEEDNEDGEEMRKEEASGGGNMQLQAATYGEKRKEGKEEAAEQLKKAEQRKDWEVGRVECECCGMEEECTKGYEERVRGGLCGHFLCGLCEEAVREEHKRLGGRRAACEEASLQAALQAHMQPCRGFSSRARARRWQCHTRCAVCSAAT